MLKPMAATAKKLNSRRILRSALTVTLILQGSIVCCLLPISSASAEGVVAIATLVPYADRSEVRDSIREDCGLSGKLSKLVVARSLKNDISMIRVGKLNGRDAGNGHAGPGRAGAPTRFLDLRITDAIETSGGLLPTHSLSIDGVLKQDNRVVGTFVGTRFARASFVPFRRGECAILAEAVRLLSKDVVRWMKKPGLDARLGDAR
jgi:hypothetical protein